MYDLDYSIQSKYDSDSSYNPYNKQVKGSFSSNDIPKSPTIGFIDLDLCDDVQEDQALTSVSNNVYENHNPISSKVIQNHQNVIKKKIYN